jgi:molecular chaperone DnaK
MARDNKTLGNFELTGIPAAPRGVPQIEVTFDIDANGILNVSAKDKATGKSQSIKIEGSSGISKDEVERMKKDAEMHATDDKKKQEMIEAKNIADTLIYTCEKTIKDAGDKIKAEDKKDIEEKINVLKESQKSDSIEDIKAKTQELSAAVQKVGAELYKQEPQQPNQEEKKDGDTEEGKYTEKQ